MLMNSLQTKWVARFFVLAYLLLITSTANAFWCQDVEADSHLESNPAGTCWFPCTPEEQEAQRNEQAPAAGMAFSAEGEDCFDSPVHSSGIIPSNQKEPKNKTTVTETNSFNSFFSLDRRLTADLGYPGVAHQLPPQQALIALRTISLLC